MIKIILIFTATVLFAGVSPYISNGNTKIIDIGSTNSTNYDTSPLIWDQYPAEYQLIEDVIYTSIRTLSDKATCLTDSLGHTNCPTQSSPCQTKIETKESKVYTHDTFVTHEKMCPDGHIKRGDRCYIDANNNGVPDLSPATDIGYYIAFTGYGDDDGEAKVAQSLVDDPNSDFPMACIMFFWKGQEGIAVENQGWCWSNENNEWMQMGHGQGDRAYQNAYQIVKSSSNKKCLATEAQRSRIESSSVELCFNENTMKFTGELKLGILLSYKTGSTKEVRYRTVSSTYRGYEPGGILPHVDNFNTDSELRAEKRCDYYDSGASCYKQYCPSGYTIDSDDQTERDARCWIPAECQAGYIEKNGQCIQYYTYYTYYCETGVNIYGLDWEPVEKGGDCFGYCPEGQNNYCKCNDAMPPKDNCVKNNFVCSSDPSRACTAILDENFQCDEGYILRNSRCEREIPYCGDNIYNYETGLCEEKSTYEKSCTDSGDIFIKEKNICVSATRICDSGTYSYSRQKCVEVAQMVCDEANGYVYDAISNTCVNSTKRICEKQGFMYSASEGICISTKPACPANSTFDVDLYRCVDDVCKGVTNSIAKARCEKDMSNACDGVVTSSGNCIPKQIQ